MPKDDWDTAIANFALRFPSDERAKRRLRRLLDDALRRVLGEFRTVADSNPDFSRRVIGLLRCFGGWACPRCGDYQ
ncbi:MAG: hypothetical protein ACKPKO_02545, partial [Candidatus Fonsibacter sp.]